MARSRASGTFALTLALALVDIGALVYVMALDVTTYHTWRTVGDLDAAGALLILGLLLFPLATELACRWEVLSSPGLFDHFRQCIILYAVLAVFLGTIWPRRAITGGSLVFAIATLLAAGAVIGLVTNGIVLALRRAHSHVNSL